MRVDLRLNEEQEQYLANYKATTGNSPSSFIRVLISKQMLQDQHRDGLDNLNSFNGHTLRSK